MAYKCSITGLYCPLNKDLWFYCGYGWDKDACPIGRYEDSSYKPKDEPYLLDDRCRYFGIARSKALLEEMKNGEL